MAKYSILENGRIAVDGARIVFRNFKGEASQYNRAGDRNFALVIDNSEFAQRLSDEGWNIKVRPPREEGGEPFIYLPVTVSYKVPRLAPKVFLIRPRKGTLEVGEGNIADFDDLEFSDIKLVVNPRHWVDDKTHEERIKAYLIEMVARKADSLHFYEELAMDESPREAEEFIPF